jgi:transposase
MNKLQTNGSTTAWGAAERSEAERSAAAHHAGAKNRPKPEVRPRAQRRSFTAAFKQKILTEADAASGSGTIGALLRREGLYSSHLTHWRQERDGGITNGLTPRTRGPKARIEPSAKPVDPRH